MLLRLHLFKKFKYRINLQHLQYRFHIPLSFMLSKHHYVSETHVTAMARCNINRHL